MGNGLIFFGEQTLAQDELRIKISSWGVRPLSSTGEEVKLILGNREYNNWNAQNVNEVNIYFEQDVRDWTYAFRDLLRSDVNLAAIYDIDTDLVGDTIIIKRKINNARLPAPSYLWQPEEPVYATTIITVNGFCFYSNAFGGNQSQYLKIFLDNTAYDVWLPPSGDEGGRSVWTPESTAERIAQAINASGTHIATLNNNIVTVIANVLETQAATTKEDPNPYTHYSNTWTYTGGEDFDTYLSGKELTFTPGASNYPITVTFPQDHSSSFWWLTPIYNALANHSHWGSRIADGRVAVEYATNGWKLEYNMLQGESGTALRPTYEWTVSTINYKGPNETEYEITSFTDGVETPEIEHSDVLVRGKSPALTIDYEIVTLAVSGSGYTDGLQPTAEIIIGGSSILVNLPSPSSTAAEAVGTIYHQITSGSHSTFVNFRTAWSVEKLNATTLRFIAKTTGNKPDSSIDFNFLEETNLAGSFTYLHGH